MTTPNPIQPGPDRTDRPTLPAGRARTVEELLDRAAARARTGLARSLRTLRAETAGALDGDLVRRHPVRAAALAAVAGAVTTAMVARLLRSPGRAFRLAARLLGPLARVARSATIG
jgi:hypothetical protein